MPSREGADDDAADEGDDLFLCCGPHTAVITSAIIALLIGVFAATRPTPDPLDTRVTSFRDDEMLRSVVWAGRGGSTTPGPNGRDTDWAVFFYRPYCGACKRVWPAFRALGATTNSTGRLRFGEVDCARDRGVCAREGVEAQPLVRLYRAGPVRGPATPTFKREVIAEWQGMLIGYELVDWFASLKGVHDGALIGPHVSFPKADELGEAMRRFKARGRTQHDTSLSRRPADPAGYLVDAELALAHGLTDHAFPRADAPLGGERSAGCATRAAPTAAGPRSWPSGSSRRRGSRPRRWASGSAAGASGRLRPSRPSWPRCSSAASLSTSPSATLSRSSSCPARRSRSTASCRPSRTGGRPPTAGPC